MHKRISERIIIGLRKIGVINRFPGSDSVIKNTPDVSNVFIFLFYVNTIYVYLHCTLLIAISKAR